MNMRQGRGCISHDSLIFTSILIYISTRFEVSHGFRLYIYIYIYMSNLSALIIDQICFTQLEKSVIICIFVKFE